MSPSSRDRISVDLRGLKAALIVRANARGVSLSDLVRITLVDALAHAEPASTTHPSADAPVALGDRIRLSLRLTRAEAAATTAAAQVAGMPLGAFIAGLIAGVPVLIHGAARDDYLAALVASSAELSTLRRNIHHLTTLLRQGEVRAAQEYRAMLDTLADDVCSHLAAASNVLAALRPRIGGPVESKHLIS